MRLTQVAAAYESTEAVRLLLEKGFVPKLSLKRTFKLDFKTARKYRRSEFILQEMNKRFSCKKNNMNQFTGLIQRPPVTKTT